MPSHLTANHDHQHNHAAVTHSHQPHEDPAKEHGREAHVHDHQHGSIRHVHAHVHGQAHAPGEATVHSHEHGERLGRSPAASFGIGLMHGVGGSAGAGLLLMGTVNGPEEGVLALGVFAAATALSMSLLTLALAQLLAQRAVRRRFEAMVPLFGTAGLLFGVWYSLSALQ